MKMELRVAGDVLIGNLIKTQQNQVGIVVGRGDPPPDAQDQTGTVQYLVYKSGRGGSEKGEIAYLGGRELVADYGQPFPFLEHM